MTELATLRQPPSPESGETEALPHNIEAEQQLLGAILTNNDVFDRVSSIVRAEHFIAPRYHLSEAEHRERTASWV